MIPLRDVIPSRTTPFVTFMLIAVNAIALLYQLATGAAIGSASLYFGANMLYLWLFGENVEDRMGHGRFALFVVVCGMTAALVLLIAITGSSFMARVLVNGVVPAVMGAYFVLFPQSRIVMLVPLIVTVQIIEVPALAFAPLWLLLQGRSGPALIVQLAGFLAGMGGVFLFRRRERLRVEWWNDVRRLPLR